VTRLAGIDIGYGVTGQRCQRGSWLFAPPPGTSGRGGWRLGKQNELAAQAALSLPAVRVVGLRQRVGALDAGGQLALCYGY